MKSSDRSLIAVLLIGVLTGMLVGCGQSQRPPERKTLEEIESTVPNLSGLFLKQTQPFFALSGLRVGEVTFEETDDASLHGQVFDQEPPSGTKVQGGSSVNLKVYRYVQPE